MRPFAPRGAGRALFQEFRAVLGFFPGREEVFSPKVRFSSFSAKRPPNRLIPGAPRENADYVPGGPRRLAVTAPEVGITSPEVWRFMSPEVRCVAIVGPALWRIMSPEVGCPPGGGDLRPRRFGFTSPEVPGGPRRFGAWRGRPPSKVSNLSLLLLPPPFFQEKARNEAG